MHPHRKLYRVLPGLLLAVLLIPMNLSAEETVPPVPEETVLDSAAQEAEKLPGSASVSQSSIIFGRQVVSPVFSSETNDSQPELTYKIQGASDDTYTREVPTAVGVYTVRVRYPETDTHLEASATGDFTIRALVTNVTLGAFSEAPSLTYNGTLQSVPVPPLLFAVEGSGQVPQPGQDYEITACELLSPWQNTDPGSLNAGLQLRFLDGLYAFEEGLSPELSFHVDVKKAPLTITAKMQASAAEFAQGPDQVTAEGLVPGDVLAEILITESETGTSLVPSQPRILRDTQDVTDQYEITLVPGTWIRQAVVTDFPVAAENLTYNGQLQNLLSAPGKAPEGTLLYEVRYHASQSRSEELLSDWSSQMPQGKEPGIYTVSFKARVEGLKDSEARSVIVILAPRPLEISASAVKTYDGTKIVPEDSVTVTMDPSQILNGQEVRVKTISDSAFQQVRCGEHLKITPGNVVLEGKDAEYYSVKITSFEGTILRRPVTVTPEPAEKTCGEEDPLFKMKTEGLVQGEQLSGSLSRTPGENAGTYAITQGSVTDELNDNYHISFTSADFQVKPAAAELRLKLSKSRARPGKTLTVTVTARNEDKDLKNENFRFPASVIVRGDGEKLAAEPDGPGRWTAKYTVPKGAKDSVSFTAALNDPNFSPAEDYGSLKISFPGTNPRTGDLIFLYGTALIVSGLLLAAILILRRRKK